jgi:FAD/FMN-containing dehydrogenase
MNTPDYQKIANDLKVLLKGEVTQEEVDREKVSRDTSIFYVKPEIVIYPKSAHDISEVLKYVSLKKAEGMDISIAMRAAGTCMTGGPLSQSIVIDATKFMNKVTSVDEQFAITEPGVYYRDFEKKTLEKGWLMPSYPASRELAAVGGIVSNNSGGEKTLTYGKDRKIMLSHLMFCMQTGKAMYFMLFLEKELKQKCNEASEGGRIS